MCLNGRKIIPQYTAMALLHNLRYGIKLPLPYDVSHATL